MDEHANDKSEPEPESVTLRVRRLVIRPKGALWSLEDDRQEVGGVFTSLDAALVFARRERRCGDGAIRVVVAAEERTDARRRAA